MFNFNFSTFENLILDKYLFKFLENYNLIFCFLISMIVCFAFKNSYKLVNKR